MLDRIKNAARRNAVPLVLFFSLWFTFAYFNHLRPGWNVNSRLDLVYALVERGTFAIDAYHDDVKNPLTATGDKAFYGGHYYCDKSPALSFMATPLYALIWQARLRSGFLGEMHSRNYGYWLFWTRYVLTVTTVGLSAALLGVLCWGLARRFGVGPYAAFVLSAGILLGTLLFGYSTLFFAYLPSALCCMASYRILLSGRLSDCGLRIADCGLRTMGSNPQSAIPNPQSAIPNPQSAIPNPQSAIPNPQSAILTKGWSLFWAGLLLGLGWFLEYTAGLAGIGLAAYALWAVRRKPCSLWKFILGGSIPVICLFTYTCHLFGEFAIPYKYEVNDFFRSEMAKGFQGIHLPRLAVLYYVTIHPFRGLFFYSPFLLLAFAGIWKILKQNHKSAQLSPLTPQSSPLTPQSSPLTPQSSVLSPKSSPLTPQPSPLTPQSSVLSPKSSPLTPQSSALSPQSSPLTPQPSPLTPQHSALSTQHFSFVPDALLSAFVIVAYLLFNSGYYMWWGGWASGPRLLCPAVPFLAAPLAFWLAKADSKNLAVFSTLLAVSLALNFMIVSVDPQVPTGLDEKVELNPRISDNLPCPVFAALLPAFCEGAVARNLGTELPPLAGFSRGLTGKTSLLPLGVLWILAGAWLWREKRRPGPAARAHPHETMQAKQSGAVK
jgi:hypothetical protein